MPDSTFNLSAAPTEVQPRLFVEPAPTPGTEAATKGKPARKTKATAVGFEPPNLGKAIHMPVPDFNDPNRKPTCLEIDFPIAEINALSHLEGNAGKPIYQMSKWWARRRSCVFRSMLIAAATEAPEDRTKTAALVWDHYYANHQKAGNFKGLKVLEPFMGGGTTVVEGSRLGFSVTGIDLNPVAWFVTKNEVAGSDPVQVQALFDHIEREVKPQVQPFYTTTCPRGHKGRWIDTRLVRHDEGGRESIPPNAIMPEGFDSMVLKPDERKPYRWDGPETNYTFWAKHGPCKGSQGKACGHRTPIFRSPVIAEKKLSTDYLPVDCQHCGCAFHAELGETRIAPGSERVITTNESPFTETTQPFAGLFSAWSQLNSSEKRGRITALLSLVDDEPGMRCPLCNQWAGQTVKRTLEKHERTRKAGDIKRSDYGIESKPVYMYLLIHPGWLEGSAGNIDGVELGGWSGAAPEATAAWYRARLNNLALIEVRGRIKLDQSEVADTGPEEDDAAVTDEAEEGEDADRRTYGPPPTITLADGSVFDTRTSTTGLKKSSFRCAADDISQDILGSVQPTGHTAPTSPYALQCYCPECHRQGFSYGGRFFRPPDRFDIERLIAVDREWASRKEEDLAAHWPRTSIAHSMRTHVKDPLPGHGYHAWWQMFQSRQLLAHALLLKSLDGAFTRGFPLDVLEQGLGAVQQYLRNQNMFAIYHAGRDCLAPFLSNPNYHPHPRTIEVGVFAKGYGAWQSTSAGITEGCAWAIDPWEPAVLPDADGRRGIRLQSEETVAPDTCVLRCGSSTDLPEFLTDTVELAITDPPFGDNVYYGDCSDFFYVWMRLPLLRWYEGLPERRYFEPERTPRATEAVENAAEHPDDREPWERVPLVPAEHLDTVRRQTADLTLNSGDPNPLFRKEPAHDFYCKTLTACWSEANRVLKAGGLLAFTFHHSEDAPWVDVLESLFNSGWLLVATYPVRSDETKGAKAAVGAKKIEYDIIHVCRKRLTDPEPVSWAKMRRWVKDEGKRYKELLERTHGKDMLPADLKIVLIGKCLEFYSRHYGQVLTGDGDVLGVGEALLGVNQLLGDLVDEAEPGKRRPPEAEPLTRTVLSLFAERDSLTWDELSKTLRGTAIPPDMLIAKGWVRKHGTRVHVIPVQERYLALRQPGRTRKNVLKTDLDQAQFLIGLAMDGVDVVKDLTDATWMPKRSVEAILDWYAATGSDAVVRDKAAVAGRLLSKWRSMPKTMAEAQMSLFTRLDEVV